MLYILPGIETTKPVTNLHQLFAYTRLGIPAAGWAIAGATIIAVVILITIFGGEIAAELIGVGTYLIFAGDLIGIGLLLVFWGLFPSVTSILFGIVLAILILYGAFRVVTTELT